MRQDIGLLYLEEEINHGIPLLHLFDLARVTHHTAHHRHQQIGPIALGMLQQRELSVGAFLGLLAHTTCVEHDQIRAIHRGGLFPAEVFEDARDALCIGHIHLAANSPDVIFALCRAHRLPPALSLLSLLLSPVRPRFSTRLPLPEASRSSTSPSSTTSSSSMGRTSFGSIRST